ncbi:MAG: acyl-CoA dehydrogenase [Chloroflexi bacterium]|nr:acyl-CoA dehydrogenase [Chloroflexota bacterium]
MDFTLPEELKQLQTLARDFVKNELLPVEKLVEEKDEFPRELRMKLRKKAIDNGLWNFAMPAEYGGGGVGMLGLAVVSEELGRVSMAVGYQGGVVGGPSSGSGKGNDFAFATEEQKQKYFIPIIRGEKGMYFSLTEPNAGSDTGNLETRAVKDGDNYILNGSKIFTTGLDDSDFGTVYAVTDWEKRRSGGITCFIVDMDAPGFTVERHIPLMGRRGLRSFELRFDNCVVPAKNILGQLGNGMAVAVSMLNEARLGGAAACLGAAVRALQMAKSYSKQRVTFGEPISRRQLIQHMIFLSEMEIQASRLMLYSTAWEADQGADITTKAMIVKYMLTESAFKVIDRCMQIHGGYGYSKDLPLEMMYRDVRLLRIIEGSSEIMEWAAARALLK